MKILRHLKEKHAYYLCSMITVGILILAIYRFPNAFGRLVESCRDFGLSIAYYVLELFDIEHTIVPSVTSLPDYNFLSLEKVFWFINYERPTTTFPESFADFSDKWTAFWALFIDENNIRYYFHDLGEWLYEFSRWATLLLPIVLIAWILLKQNLERENDVNAPPGKPYRAWQWISFHILFPVKRWLAYFFGFIRERQNLWKFWLLIGLLCFNALTILIEFLAFYFYFVISFDWITIYDQVYKLILDLWAVVSFMPPWGWLIIVYVVLELWSRSIGYDNLAHNERRNRGFLNKLGIVTYIYAEMGEGKTTMLTDWALSMEAQLRDDALEVILECDACFPNFPWYALEKALKSAYENHEIWDKWSCLRWIDERRKIFAKSPQAENLFGYDIEHYPITHDNKLYVEDIWDVLQDYALAYTIYTIQSSLIVSNYSIRIDNLFMDLGNFPLWNHDFFRRDSRLLDSFSRHSHILDFDMLRLGKKMLKNNPNKNAFGWGVWVITEADKEFKNTLELAEVKSKSEECNQKNDLSHVLVKMSRHACEIRHRNFVRIIADMQRIENITANLRQVGGVAFIAGHEECRTVLPFWAPYKHLSPILLPLKAKLDGYYVNGRFLGSDKQLSMYALEQLRSFIGRWSEGITNTFGTEVMRFEMQSGRMDGSIEKKKYFKSYKKDYAKRNGSDCMASVFSSRAENNLIGLEDMAEYADYIATNDELLCQNSHMQEEMMRLQDEESTEMKNNADMKPVEKQLAASVELLTQVQAGKTTVTDEANKALRLLIKELCSTVSDWAGDEEKKGDNYE